MDQSRQTTDSPAARSRRPIRLWAWFAGGFLVAFIGQLPLISITTIHPSGRYAVRSRLWQYYADGIPPLSGYVELGPGRGDGSMFLQTLFFHLLLSAATGALAASIGWLLLRRQRRS